MSTNESGRQDDQLSENEEGQDAPASGDADPTSTEESNDAAGAGSGGDGGEGSDGDTDKSAAEEAAVADTDMLPGEDQREEIEEEREKRLSPENRPDNAEVDNTQRTFDTDAGLFTDSEDFDENDKPYAGGEE